jgi:hypothetical protein
VRSFSGAFIVVALAGVLGCKAERVLAVASMVGVDGSASDATVMPADAGDAGNNDGGGDDGGGTGGGGGTDGGSGWTPFGTPQLVTGLRSDTDVVEDPALTFEETELYFVSPTGATMNDIWVSRRTAVSDPWGPSTLVTELSSPQNDEDPEVSVDGLFMYFTSDRGGAGRHLYVSQRRTRDTPWETPMRLDLGPASYDAAPTLDRNQLLLVFASGRGAATVPHLFSTTRVPGGDWQPATEITALSSGYIDSDPALFSDGRAIVFSSRRLTQGGAADLFQAARADVSVPFASSLAPISELNGTTSSSEEDPWMSQSGRHILFVSDRNGRKRIYEATR